MKIINRKWQGSKFVQWVILLGIFNIGIIWPSTSRATINLLENIEYWKAHMYLANQIKGIGLVDSYVEDNQSISYVYDNALTVIALLQLREFGLAEKILNNLCFNVQKTTTPSGLLYESYNLSDPNGSGQGLVYAGNTAWLLEALNIYQKITGLKTYAAFQKTLADYLMTQQTYDGGIVIMSGSTIKSTEHNLAAYAALYNYGKLNGMQSYIDAATRVKNFLITNMWIPSENHFRTSLPDPPSSQLLLWATDAQALGVLALGSFYSPALTWADDPTHLQTTKTITGTGITVTGFDFNYDRDTVWIEGTLQMALAYRQVGLKTLGDKYRAEASKTQQPDGSYLLATNHGTASLYWNLDPWRAAAPSAWRVFYYFNFNPLALY